MPVLLSDRSKRLAPIDYAPDALLMNGGGGGGGGGGFEFPRGGDFFSLPTGGGGFAPAPVAAEPAPAIDFDFDLSQIGQAIRRGNTEADIRSAYELFSTGQTSGRALGYAQDVQRRFGAPSLRHAAASYLDAAGLPRLAQFVSPDPVSGGGGAELGEGDFFSLPTPPDPASGTGTGTGTAARNPLEILADVFARSFGGAVYNPPLQSQAYGYTPADVSVAGGGGGGLGNLRGWLLLAGLAVAAYFIYKRVKGGA